MRRLLLGLLVAANLIAACSNEPNPPRSPEPTVETAGTASAPALATPQAPSEVRVVGDGSINLQIAPGDRQFIEPLTLAQAFGSPPACAGFAFVFAWRMDGDATIRFEGQLSGATVQVIEGHEGATTSGCMVLEAVNDSAEAVSGELRYLIGEFR